MRGSLPSLLQECETFFSETRLLIERELSLPEEDGAGENGSAPTAGRSGPVYASPEWTGWQSPGPATPAESPPADSSPAPEASSPASGGSPALDWKTSLILRVRASYTTKPGSTQNG